MPYRYTVFTSLNFLHNNNFTDYTCRLRSFHRFLLLLFMQAHATVVGLRLVGHLLLQPLLPVTAVLILDRSLAAFLFHVLLDMIELS